MDESPGPFTVERDIADGDRAACLRVGGEMDMFTVVTFEKVFSAALDDAHGPLRIDLSGVTFMDSSGLNALIRARNAMEDRGLPLVISGISDQVRHLFEISGLTNAFVIVQS